jgi:phosphoglycolate phosphatase
MIKLVVFDWNGTLFSDTTAALVGVNARLKYLGHDPITMKHYKEIFEIPATKTYEKLGLDSDKTELEAKAHSEAFHTAYEKRAVNVRTRSGTRELLQYLNNSNIQSIILSNHTKQGIDFQLKRLKLSMYFEDVLANQDIWSSNFKGKNDRLVDYLKDANLKPKEILIIGDSAEEVIIGKSLGLHTVAITGGFVSTKRLKESNPDVLIHNLRDLIDVVKEIK